jgi:23S rRNA (cytidine1920-2'-O)/16S rRNA (cytidine1409-2'-O)-methyltransferase
VVDAGSSTGGFTDCLLQHGAARVFAVDVGRNQLHERIAGDARVTWREGTNIRDMEPADLPFVCSLLVADLSFISLVTVLPALSRLVTGDGALPAEMVLLVKPQFEVGREEASRGRGVITDPVLHRASVDKVAGAAVALGWSVEGEMESPLKGQDGNTEFLLHLRDAGRS